MNEGNEVLIVPEDPCTDTLRVPVLKVFDGDGFLTRITDPRRNAEIEVSIRFGFIDAPEMGQFGGREARDFLISLIGGKWVEIAILTKMDTGGIVDRHGRIVCIPYLTQENSAEEITRSFSNFHFLTRIFRKSVLVTRNIELEMVLNGWAWVLERYGPDERYLEALEDARRHKRGIWAFDNNVHPWEFKKQKYRSNEVRRPPSPQSQSNSKSPCPMAGCGGNLVERSGRFGVFCGCSNYPKCKYSRSTLG